MIRPVELALTLLTGVVVGMALENGSSLSPAHGLACVDPAPPALRVDERRDIPAQALMLVADPAREKAVAYPADEITETESTSSAPAVARGFAGLGELWQAIDAEHEREPSATAASLRDELTRKHMMWPVNRLIERYGAPSNVELGPLMRLQFTREAAHAERSCVRFALQDGLVCCVDVR